MLVLSGRPPRQFQSLFICWFIYKLLKMYKVIFGAGSGACVSLLPSAWSDWLVTDSCLLSFFVLDAAMLDTIVVPLT